MKYEESHPDYYENKNITIVIDAFRAFATAAYVLSYQPASYLITNKDSVISRLAMGLTNPLLIGKTEIGSYVPHYHIPNSPTRVKETQIEGRHVLHRTQAGAKGIILSKNSDIILAAGFVNADATVEYIQKFRNSKVKILPMGHEGTTPSLDDNMCKNYIEALLEGKNINWNELLINLKEGPGKYFFGEDQWQYPREDFDLCLKLGRFNFAIQAIVKEDYATLTLCDKI